MTFKPTRQRYEERPEGRFTSRSDHVPYGAVEEPPHSRLRDTLREVPAKQEAIEGAGLTCLYIILGSPGSGKTMLFLNIVEKTLELNLHDTDLKYGALILDPKAALIEDLLLLMANRPGDLTILNPEWLRSNGRSVNIIDCSLNPWELGRALVLAAQGAGINAADEFWLQELTNLFGAALSILCLLDNVGRMTLRQLIEGLLLDDYDVVNDKSVRRILLTVAELERALAEETGRFSQAQRREALLAVAILRRIYSQDYLGTIEALIQRAYGRFARAEFDCFSGNELKATSFYDDIPENGDVVLVSLPPSESDAAKLICTLVKLLFQQTVMGRKERCVSRKLKNWTRPVLIACDEYSQIASEIPGQPAGDGQFFALSRENGCMGLLATQSVNMLANSSLRDAWKSVFSTAAAKIFMSANDIETVEEASRLAGDEDWTLLIRGFSRNRDGGSVSSTPELRERKSLPNRILTRLLKQRQAVIIGSLDGRKTQPGILFLESLERA